MSKTPEKVIDASRNPTPADEGELFAKGRRADVRSKWRNLDVERAKMGPIGRLFGSKDPSMKAAFVVICACLLFMALALVSTFDREAGAYPASTMALLYLLGSFVTGCIGFIFGMRK